MFDKNDDLQEEIINLQTLTSSSESYMTGSKKSILLISNMEKFPITYK